jgi:hypothetical protein
MSKRSENWDKNLSSSLLESEQERKEYFLALIDEGFEWREALKITVESIGIKEYAEMSGIKPPNLISQLSSDKDIRLSTLEKIRKQNRLNFFCN